MARTAVLDFARQEGEGDGAVIFKLSHALFRFLVILFEIGALTYVAWAYSRWQAEALVRVDVLFPCFFPIIVALIMDTYEVISLLCLKRKRPINPVAVCFDIVVAGVGVFCFVAISMSGYSVYRGIGAQPGSPRYEWAGDVGNVMIFMMVFSLLHAFFILGAAAGGVYFAVRRKRAQRDERVARSQAEMIQFNERQKKLWATQNSMQVLPHAA
ncbi:hypothetical protein QBC34DRAFT_391970 [Podospora aff. communis PSN243]|uniref:MARVEL domain-containing protein n=1 Tax=Podospora aff. communis PSN243 TaxID=3040156 RepID=A0AAV9H1I8_9PEZI|nr:hypothetical protein QBC34DRAFT_391970 [Podospora aff. communis PSN243]